ncbi:MAG: DJ-1/PfpI family protein [Nitrospirae bacterium]|nr:DJ-1/PfpI family protein [Nitrospirota bacterium]
MKKRVLVPLAQGFEEIEAVSVIDILRRADIEVVVAGLEEGPLAGRTGIRIVPDSLLEDVADQDFDMVVLPGGLEGTRRLAADPRLKKVLAKAMGTEGKFVGAICAAPTVLAEHGLAAGRRVVQDKMKDAVYESSRVVRDDRLITSRGAGTAVEFAFALVEALLGPEAVARVNQGVLARL